MQIHSISRVLATPFIILAVGMIFYSYTYKKEYSAYIFVPVTILVALYVLHGPIDHWWKTKYPIKLDKKLKDWLSSHFVYYNTLNPSELEKFEYRMGLYLDGRLFKSIGAEQRDVPEDIKLSVGQQNQVLVAKSKEPIIDKQAIQELLGELEFPLYFLDYETVSSALPMFNGCTPFQQIPFQYSLHVLREPNGELEHYEYLGRDNANPPMPELLASLRSHIGGAGSVTVWYKVFETGRNTEMGRAYPEYAEFLNGVNDRVFDLMDVFSKQYFVHHDFKGSSSIKYVLPVLVPEFSYKEMDIQNGLVASIRWYDAVMGIADEQQAGKTYEALLKYCCLDTLAMVKIYEYLRKI